MIAVSTPHPLPKPRPQVRRLPGRKRMTIAIGLLATDGVVIADDTQESDGFAESDLYTTSVVESDCPCGLYDFSCERVRRGMREKYGSSCLGWRPSANARRLRHRSDGVSLQSCTETRLHDGALHHWSQSA